MLRRSLCMSKQQLESYRDDLRQHRRETAAGWLVPALSNENTCSVWYSCSATPFACEPSMKAGARGELGMLTMVFGISEQET